MALRAIGFALAVLAVPGCALIKQTPAGAVLASLKPGADKGERKSAADIPLASIRKAGQPIMRLNIPRRGADTLISIRDDRPPIRSWMTQDGMLFTFRNNVLVETRGLGPDLMSAAAPSAGQIAAGGSYGRSYFILGADDQIIRYDFACRAENRGAETLVIYGVPRATRHVAETCDIDGQQIVNDYWFEGGTIRKSREWVGPRFSYLEFERVVD